jgi:hypothetical protein
MNLADLIPDADAVLALEPDELGLRIILVLGSWPGQMTSWQSLLSLVALLGLGGCLRIKADDCCGMTGMCGGDRKSKCNCGFSNAALLPDQGDREHVHTRSIPAPGVPTQLGAQSPPRLCCGVCLFRNQYGRRLMYGDIRRDPKAASEGKARCRRSGDRDGRTQALRILPDCSRCFDCHNCGHPVFDSRVDDGRLAEIAICGVATRPRSTYSHDRGAPNRTSPAGPDKLQVA